MAKFRENELVKFLQDFAKESKIKIDFEGSIDGKLVLEGATVTFDNKNGYININSKSGKLKINTTLVYRYEEIKKDIYIYLDSEIMKIKKI